MNFLLNDIIEDISITSLALNDITGKLKSSGGSKGFKTINIDKLTIELLAVQFVV